MKLCITVWLLSVVGPTLSLFPTVPTKPNNTNITTHPHYPHNEPTTESNIIRNIFDLEQHDNDDIVSEGKDTKYIFDEAIRKTLREDVIPELCYLTSDNITIYNSFLLDHTCLQHFEQVSPQCRDFKCQLAHYFLQHGARVFGEFFQTETLKNAVLVVEREFSAGFRKLNMCTCGREFFKAAFKCAPYYYANALFALVDNDEDDITFYGKFTRNVDLKSTSKVFDRLMEGFCAETGSGLCLSTILNAIGKMGEMFETTIDDYDSYDEGTRKFRKSQEKRCDALFGPLRAWEKDDRRLPNSGQEEEYMEILFNKTAAVANSFYCDKSCKKTRNVFYPCCLKKIVEDRKMWENVEKAVESVFRVVPAMNYYFQYKNYSKFWNWKLYAYFWHEYTEEEFANFKTFSLPKVVRKAFLKTINGPKYCKGKLIRCNKN
jgi:hypothetical protein